MSAKKVGVVPARCIGCGACVRACPLGVMTLTEGVAAPDPRRRCLECFHCAAACPTRAITWEGLEEAELYRPMPEGELERAVAMRRSTRHYREECPDRELIARILDRAEYAPSSKNEHQNCWTVVLGREKTDALLPLVRAWGEETGRRELAIQAQRGLNMITCGAPCLIVGHAPESAGNPEGDTVIALTTAELLLHRAGLSACWGGYLKRAINATPALRELLAIPEGHTVYGVLMAGWADGETYCNVPWRKPADVNWIG